MNLSRLLTPVTPDWDGLIRNLKRQGTPERVFYFEHGIAENTMRALGELGGLDAGLLNGTGNDAFRRVQTIHRMLGHELFRVFPPGARFIVPPKEGAWVEEGRGPVATWAEFEAYPWPDPRAADYSVLDYFETNLPANQRVFHVLDFWEIARNLFGFETLCFALYEEPELVEAVFQRVGEFVSAVVEAVCSYDCYGAVYIADDLGYRTSLLIAPDQIRHYVIPWHRRFAAIAHRHDKLFFLHSCGQIYSLIDDYIDEVKIDAKHSFEENVLPVADVKKLYGARLSLLGGMDVDILARGDETAIRRKSREMLAACHPGGGYCFGSGNWVTDYIPVENYLFMLDEARRFL